MGLVAVLTTLRDNDEPLRDPLLVLAQRVCETADDMLLLTREYSKAAQDPSKQFNCGCLQWHDLNAPHDIIGGVAQRSATAAVPASANDRQRAGPGPARSGTSSGGGQAEASRSGSGSGVVVGSGSGAAAGSGSGQAVFRSGVISANTSPETAGFLQAEAAGRAFAFESLKLQIGELMMRMMSKLQVCVYLGSLGMSCAYPGPKPHNSLYAHNVRTCIVCCLQSKFNRWHRS